MLGMSPDEIDSLHAFRETGRFLQSPDEFQSITGVSDSLLAEIAVYFKFPGQRSLRPEKNRGQLPQGRIVDKVRQDLNTASAIDLMKIRGIGEVLSARILKFRKALGGFVVAEQLYDVYGLDKAVADRVLEKYTVVKKPQIRLIDLNLASVEEISSSVYITNALARRIVAYRNINGPFEAWDELTKIEDFPIQQIDRIKLYLTL